MGMAIFLALFAVSFTKINGEVNLTLKNYPLIMMLLVSSSILLALVYIWIDKNKLEALSKLIEQTAAQKLQRKERSITNLTARQREVYDLIISGKSNKEIMRELFIEQSTLKSHINQLYKKLEINSRNELKALPRD